VNLSSLNSTYAWRTALCVFAGVLVVFGGIAIANSVLPGKSGKDYALWHRTGQLVLDGEPIYPPQNNKSFPFMYPPTAAVLLAPVSALGRTGLVVVLVLVNAAAWTASVLLSVRLATGTWKRQHLLLYAAPSVIISVFAWSNFHLGQPTLLLLAVMLAGFVALQTKRHWSAGALFAFAAAVKAFPVVVLAYLVYRRFWIAVASLVVVLAALLFVLPAPFRGVAQASTDMKRWTEGMLLKYDEKGVAQRPARSYSWKNQSIFGLAHRLLRNVDANADTKHKAPFYGNFANLDFRTVTAVILGAGLLLGLLYLAAMPPQAQRTAETDGIEFALFILLLLMFTPLSFGYLFASLLFPFTVALKLLLDRTTTRLLAFCLAAVVLVALSIPLQIPAQVYGNYFFAALLLFIGLGLELWNRRRPPASA
jgi:hypothetical protein